MFATMLDVLGPFRPLTRPVLAALACALVPLGGCAPAARKAPPAAAKHDDHDHDDHAHADHAHPETLAAGVTELAAAVAGLKEKIAGDRGAADTAVHDIGHLLEDVRGLLPKAGLAAEAQAAAGKALDELEECFGKLDEALHAAEGAGDSPADVHASIGERVEKALAALREAK